MQKISRFISLFLLMAILLSLLPVMSVMGAEGEEAEITEVAEEAILPEEKPATKVAASSVSVPSYSGGTSSGWMTYDCGANLALSNTGKDSKMMIVKSTSATQFNTYVTTLKNKGYTVLSSSTIAAQSGSNIHYKLLASDRSHVVYTYFTAAYSETRIIVDTNKDTFRAYSYTSAGPGSGNGRTEVYAIPVSASEDGFLHSSAYGAQNRNNAGAMLVIKMSDNSLFVVDGGSYMQMSDRDCERVYALLRKITGLPEGQKIYVNTWFLSHCHDDHISGFPRLLQKYHSRFEVQNVMYNFGDVGASADNMLIMAQLFPNAKYYKPHTGENFSISGVQFEVLYTLEDLYTPNSSNKLVLDNANCKKKSNEENNDSVVLRVSFDGKTMILSGDVYDGDAIIMAMYPASYLHADVLQIPHHGFDSHATYVKTIAPTVSFIHQQETAMKNRKSNYNADANWAPYAGTRYYINSETVGYCAAEGVFFRKDFTEDVDWLDWGNKTWILEEANAYTSGKIADPESYYRYDRYYGIDTGAAVAIVDDKLGYILSYDASTGATGNLVTPYYSGDTYYLAASQRRLANWQIKGGTAGGTNADALATGSVTYTSSITISKGTGDYWGTNSKNNGISLGYKGAASASNLLGTWSSFANQLESTSRGTWLDQLSDGTWRIYRKDGSTYYPLYRDPSSTEGKGWGTSSLTKSAADAKQDYIALRLYAYNPTADTMYLSWTGHKDYYADPGVSKVQLLSLLSADIRVNYSFKNSPGTGEIHYDGQKDDAPVAGGTYYFEFPGSFSGSTAGNYTVSIKFKNHAGTIVDLGSFVVHINNRSSDPATKSLFIDFNDDADARKRYFYDSQYGGYNYDSTNTWEFIEYINSSNTTTGGFVDTLSGTLRLYTSAANTTNRNLSVRTYAGSTTPLAFSPKNAEIFQIRFKMDNLKAASGKNPYVGLWYFKNDGSGNVSASESTTHSLGTSFTSDGKYMTVTITLSSTFKNSTKITGIRPAFCNLIPTSTSKKGVVTIDYIYIGPKSGAPASEDRSLYFTFDNSAESQARYQSNEHYNNINFDRMDQPNWATEETSTSHTLSNDRWINNQDGTLVVRVAEDHAMGTNNSYFGPWVLTTGVPDVRVIRSNRTYQAIGYEPQEGDFIQLRFKLDGCVLAEGYANPQIVVSYDRSIDGVSDRGSYSMVADYTFQNGVYQTVTIPVNSQFATSDCITSLGFRFWHIKSATKGSGTVSIDYIYVGGSGTSPSLKYTAYFANYDGSILAQQTLSSGGTASYTGATPTRAADANYHYTFKGWDKALTNVTVNTTFTAQYTATAHSFTYTTVDSTNHKATCSCGYTATTSHTWNGGTVTTQPNCTTEGITTYTCTRCNATKTEIVPTTGHNYTNVVTPPTCTAEGYTAYTCTGCGHTYTDTPVAPKGHTEVTDKAVAATCTASGLTEGKHCSVCSAIIVAQEIVEATGHSPIYTPKDADSHIITCENCDYTAEKAHSYVDNLCICGQAEIKEPVENTAWKLGHTLNLASDISVNFAISKSALDSFDLSTVYVESILETYDGNEKTGTISFRLEPVENGNYYYFTLTGLTAVQMNNRITSTLYGIKDGQPYYSAADDYSVADYAYSQMNKSNMPATLKTLCADLLRYGAKAQIFKSYRTDSLADAGMTDVHKAYLSDMEAVTFGNCNEVLNDLADPSVTWAGKALNLESKVCLKFIFAPGTYQGAVSDLTLRVSYEDTTGTTKTLVLDEAELYNADRGYYAFTLDALLAAELRSVVSVQVYAGNTPVSCTLQYSADTYGNNKTGTLLALCKALFAYSDSAKAYFVK